MTIDDKFAEELLRLLNINHKVTVITPNTIIEGLDSLTTTELCVIVEETYGVPIEFAEMRALSTVEQLMNLIEGRMEQLP